jgi:ectoine hydroxylase-related dioxygenase (phytanoyl-CoA dioxygenase family)
MNSFERFKKNGFGYFDYNSSKDCKFFIKKMQNIVKAYYSEPIKNILKWKVKKFYDTNLKIREEFKYAFGTNINSNTIRLDKFMVTFANIFCKSIKKNINDYYITSDVSILFTRPSSLGVDLAPDGEFVDFHRENFYSDAKTINHQINFWVPIFNVSLLQNFKYVPKSHFIPDDKIILKKEINNFVKKKSSAHQCGINYAPKRIVGGVEMNKAKRFNVPKGKFLAFDSMLIHGGGINLSKKIRFAISFGIVPKKITHKFGNPIISRLQTHNWVTPNLN